MLMYFGVDDLIIMLSFCFMAFSLLYDCMVFGFFMLDVIMFLGYGFICLLGVCVIVYLVFIVLCSYVLPYISNAAFVLISLSVCPIYSCFGM